MSTTVETERAYDPIRQQPRCLEDATRGIKTASEFARFMSHLMSDIIDGGIPPQVANAAVNAGGKLLKVVEMQYRWGRSTHLQEIPRDVQLIREDKE